MAPYTYSEDSALSELIEVRQVLDKIADKWTILILTVLCEKPARFNDIKRRLGGITHKALSDALKRLERLGLVTRTVLPTQPIGVEYAITPVAISLRAPFRQLYDWALLNSEALNEAQTAYDEART
ncbi:MAG: HxlR family transcriptional regulator [Devosia sp.]|jgi:DNA-binding HxlR family transcriptional regulator|nr:HxlR family transcriptional regulator [Devosia sp.]